jgi:ubiquinone/menaquinone biosynthesis C-methylase UbiE
MSCYDALSAVYDWLMPAELLAPLGSAEAFAGLVDLEPGARVLDCACGPGHLARRPRSARLRRRRHRRERGE